MTPLKTRIEALIRAEGPLTVAQYMQMALLDPAEGYYVRRDPLGTDFTTAPEISQMFGELVGLFFVQAWEDRGRPSPFSLVEMGPGRGTMMADALRAASKIRPAFIGAARIVLVEASPVLRDRQKRALAPYPVRWTDDFGSLAQDTPLFLAANEFFDALPVRQFVKGPKGWHERVVALTGDALSFALTPDPQPASFLPAHLRGAAPGSTFEIHPSATILMREIAQWIAAQGGVALAIDYGHAASGLGDTLQAIEGARFADVLVHPGAADLTAHVDFMALGQHAQEAGARVFGPVTQGVFLEALGIRARAARLKTDAPQKAAEIDAALDRLVAPEKMGILFKVLGVADSNTPHLPGFPC